MRPIDGTLKGTTILDQNQTKSNCNEGILHTLHSPEFQIWSLTTGFNLVSYVEHTF